MGWEASTRNILAGAVVLLALLFAIGWLTREDPAEDPYLQVLGGGFMFNYREGEVFTALPQKSSGPLRAAQSSKHGSKTLPVDRPIGWRSGSAP